MQINIDDKVVKFLDLADWYIKFSYPDKILIIDWTYDLILSFLTPTITWDNFISELCSFAQNNKWLVLDIRESIGDSAVHMLAKDGVRIDRHGLYLEAKKVDKSCD